MTYNNTRTRKPTVSAHQKQIRFLAGLLVFIGLLLVALFCWLVNQPIN